MVREKVTIHIGGTYNAAGEVLYRKQPLPHWRPTTTVAASSRLQSVKTQQ